jgi:hypothetical protein
MTGYSDCAGYAGIATGYRSNAQPAHIFITIGCPYPYFLDPLYKAEKGAGASIKINGCLTLNNGTVIDTRFPQYWGNEKRDIDIAFMRLSSLKR